MGLEMLGWGLRRLRWGLRRFIWGLPNEFQMGPFRKSNGDLGGSIGPWVAWMVPYGLRWELVGPGRGKINSFEWLDNTCPSNVLGNPGMLEQTRPRVVQ